MGEFTMTLTVAHITPLVSLLAGILILIVPTLLNYIIANLPDRRGFGRSQRNPSFSGAIGNSAPCFSTACSTTNSAVPKMIAGSKVGDRDG
jgi:hypothetical protein